MWTIGRHAGPNRLVLWVQTRLNGAHLGEHTAGYTSFWLRVDNVVSAHGSSPCGD